MPSTVHKKTLICSVDNAIKKSKVTGKLDLCNLTNYMILINASDLVKDITNREDIYDKIQDKIQDTQYTSPDITKDIKPTLPDYPYVVNPSTGDPEPTGGSGSGPITNISIASDFTVSNIVQENIFGVGNFYDTYVFSISDFEAAYSDNNNNDFHAIRIYRGDLDGMTLKVVNTPTTGNVFGENDSWITILKADIPKWRLFSTSTSIYSHNITYRFVDLVGTTFIESNTATLTVNRTGGENQPPTIGDNTQIVDNRAVTTFTLAMFTTQLAPPYNDPEGDLIDAIRIDEISTANQGVFKLNGITITEGQIITREDLNAGLFTHEAANVDTISSDVFSFSARDEGSQIWVS